MVLAQQLGQEIKRGELEKILEKLESDSGETEKASHDFTAPWDMGTKKEDDKFKTLEAGRSEVFS